MNRLFGQINYKKVLLIFASVVTEFIFNFLLIINKYQLHDLSIKRFDLWYVGNLIQIVIAGVLISLILLFLFKHWRIKIYDLQIVLNLQLFSILLLCIHLFIIKENFFLGNVLNNSWYESEKMIVAILNVSAFFIKIYVINYLLLVFLSVKQHRVIKNLILSLSFYILLIMFTFFYSIIISKSAIEFKIRRNDKFDKVIVLGSAVWKLNKPSPLLEGRLLKAYSLYKRKMANKIVLTGGNAPGELTEAEVGKSYLVSIGVDSSMIEIETETTSTIEQIHYVKKYHISPNVKVCVISDGFHLPRAREIAKFNGLGIKFIRSDSQLGFITNFWYRIRESVLLILFWLFGI